MPWRRSGFQKAVQKTMWNTLPFWKEKSVIYMFIVYKSKKILFSLLNQWNNLSDYSNHTSFTVVDQLFVCFHLYFDGVLLFNEVKRSPWYPLHYCFQKKDLKLPRVYIIWGLAVTGHQVKKLDLISCPLMPWFLQVYFPYLNHEHWL